MMNGRKCDVLIYDDLTNERALTIYADEGYGQVIGSVEGVTWVGNLLSKTQYHAYLDPRYDKEYIKKEIEAAILCADKGQK